MTCSIGPSYLFKTNLVPIESSRRDESICCGNETQCVKLFQIEVDKDCSNSIIFLTIKIGSKLNRNYLTDFEIKSVKSVASVDLIHPAESSICEMVPKIYRSSETVCVSRLLDVVNKKT